VPGAAPELGDFVIRAGAGAGKTRGLVEKVAEVFRLYKAVGEVPRIVVTTFTRKSTQELKERLIFKACEEEDAELLRFVSDPSKLHISTIHGLLNVFMRQVGHLAGLDAGFQLVSEAEGFHLARIALRETILANSDGMRWLEIYGFERVLGMCRRYEVLRREQTALRPATLEDIQAASADHIESWRQKVLNMAATVLEECDDKKLSEYAQTVNGFALNWKGSSIELEAIPRKPARSAKRPELDVWHDLIDSVIPDFKEEMRKECWNQELWPSMAQAWTDFAPFAEDFVAGILRLKESQARFELSDLELKSMEMLRSHPHLGVIFSDGWDFWMIDEYQDTSPLQVAVLEALIGDKPTYYVGDPQQSIYLFRGAEVRVFTEAEKKIGGKGGTLRQLRRNYRSKPDLLLFINDFFKSLGSDFEPMEPKEPVAAVDRTSVKFLRAVDYEQELNAVVVRIQELMADGAGLEDICILGRTHSTLMDVSKRLREYGFPTHVHSARGFNLRREVLDAQALWKFLVNPHDNLNLTVLLRSPWFFVKDAQLMEWMANKPFSLWSKLQALEVPESVQRLRDAQQQLSQLGLARTFEETLISAAFLDLSLINDPAGRKESNLWKLILRARSLEKEGGASALDFLSGGAGDPLDVTEGDATSAQEPNSINLMTIHGSKGLEFEHVIIPRMGERPQTSKTAPLDANEGVFFFPVAGGEDEQGESAFVPSPLDYMKVIDQRERELTEFNRWLYVALTRAKSTLTLSWSKIDRNSWASGSDWFLREAGQVETENYRFEIVDKFDQPTGYLGSAKEAGDVRELWRAPDRQTEERHSVTDLVTVKTHKIKSEDLIKGWQARALGTRIHRALEALKYGEDIPEDSKLAAEFVLGIIDPPMRHLIQEGSVEWGFQVQTPAGVIEGQIDLWAKHDGKIYIVDYKSGSNRFKEAAFEQLSLYAWALRKFGHKEPIELMVIYPLTQKFEKHAFDEKLFVGWEMKFRGTEA
jgi:ATP-dependent helicase/nuclease subunit A